MCFSLSVLATGSLLALFISACFNTFFYSCFWKAIRTFCAILSSLFSQAACVVLTLLSCKAFLLNLFGVFFLSFSMPPCFFSFSAFIFKCLTEEKLLTLGKRKQTLHIYLCFLEQCSGVAISFSDAAWLVSVHNMRLAYTLFCFQVLISTLLLECVFFALLNLHENFPL